VDGSDRTWLIDLNSFMSHKQTIYYCKYSCTALVYLLNFNQYNYLGFTLQSNPPVSRNKVSPSKSLRLPKWSLWLADLFRWKSLPCLKVSPRHETESLPYGKPPPSKSLVVRILRLSQRLKSNSNEVSCDSDCTKIYELKLVVLTYNLKATAW